MTANLVSSVQGTQSMLVGINAGFGAPLRGDRAFIESVGFSLVRQEFRVDFSDRTLAALIGEFAGGPLALLALLGGGTNRTTAGARIEPAMFASLGSRVVRVAQDLGVSRLLIEVGNEPDIGHPGYARRPRDFAAAVAQTHGAVRQAGFTGTVVSGGVSNLSRERLVYLEQVAAGGLPPDVVLGFHRYPRGLGPERPHPGFTSRDDEWARLRAIAGTREVACTEFGHHTARRRHERFGLLRRRRRISDEDVAGDILFDLRFFRDRGCLLSAIYQLNDGLTDTPIDRYGIRRADGRPKPAVAAIAEFIRTTS